MGDTNTPAVPPKGATPPPEGPPPTDPAATLVDDPHADTVPDPTGGVVDPGTTGDHFDSSITLTEIRVPFRVHSHFLRFGQAQAIQRLLEANPGDDDYDKLFYGAVAFLGPGAITAACVWLHRRGFPESTIHLLGLAREDSPSARELMTAGTNKKKFFTRDIQVNLPDDKHLTNNLIVITEEPEKRKIAANAHLIFMNAPFRALNEVITPDWIACLRPGARYALPNFTKSFEEKAGRVATEELYMRFAAEERADLTDAVAFMNGYTSAPKIYEGKITPHIEIVVTNEEVGKEILAFFMDPKTNPIKHPEFANIPEAPENFYVADHITITLTVGNRDVVIAAALAAALKNPLVIQTGFDIGSLFLGLNNFSMPYVNDARKLAEKRREQDISTHLPDFLKWEGIRAKPSIATIEDIMGCSRIDYEAMVALAQEFKQLVVGGQIHALKKLISDTQADKTSRFGSRNMQVGLYLAMAHYAKEKGLIDFEEEVFNATDPTGWNVQEGVPGIRYLWKRRIRRIAGEPMELPYGVREDSPRANGQELPDHFQFTRTLVYPGYSLPIEAIKRLNEVNAFRFIARGIEKLNELYGSLKVEVDVRNLTDIFSGILDLLFTGFKSLIGDLKAHNKFKNYLLHLGYFINDVKQAITTGKFDKTSFFTAVDHLIKAMQIFDSTINGQNENGTVEGNLAEVKNHVRRAERQLKQGEELRIESLVTNLMSLRQYNPPLAMALRGNSWKVNDKYIPADYDDLSDEQKMIQPWGLPRPWIHQLGALVTDIANVVDLGKFRKIKPNQEFIRGNLYSISIVLGTLKETRGTEPNVTGLLIEIHKKIDRLIEIIDMGPIFEDYLARAVEHFSAAFQRLRAIFGTLIDDETLPRVMATLQLTHMKLTEAETEMFGGIRVALAQARALANTDHNPTSGILPEIPISQSSFPPSPPVREGRGEGVGSPGSGRGETEASTVVRIESRAPLIHGGAVIAGNGVASGNMEHLMVGGAALALQAEPLVIAEPVAKPARHLRLVEKESPVDDQPVTEDSNTTVDQPLSTVDFTIDDFNPIMVDVIARSVVSRPALRLVGH